MSVYSNNGKGSKGMYLKSLSIENFRKFRATNNQIDFVGAADYKKDEKINIAPKTTLIIGKNNSGKTTVVEALKKLVQSESFYATDFNFNYLKELLVLYTLEYLESEDKKQIPTLTFTLTVVTDNSDEDLLTNIIPFMTLGDTKNSEVTIIARWAPKEDEVFFKAIKKFILNAEKYKSQKFDRFIDLLNDIDFSLTYFNQNYEKREFSLKNLIDLESICANNITGEECLSKAFSKIIDYRYKQLKENNQDTGLDELDENIIAINETLTVHLDKSHTQSINTSLGKMLSGKKCKVLLKSDLNFRTLLNNVLKYQYLEGDNHIPETQYGLGYTNLMMIIANIITYMEKYPENSFNSQINLISIEEPETYMHPQMQELFIKNVNEMISSLLEGKNKHVNSQIIITTHSPHILNSKIHQGNSFDNINYITENRHIANVIQLSDSSIMEVPEKTDISAYADYIKNLRYFKKHVKFKISELFFADAVIFVEGITEYTLLQYFLDSDPRFNKYYITLVLVDGAHSKVYEKLIYLLRIPCLSITDVDIKREDFEKDIATKGKRKTFLQMTSKSLADRITTNDTLSHFYGTNVAKDIIGSNYVIKDNLMVSCQKQKIGKYYPTSFEEAFILTNETVDMLKTVISRLKPGIYKDVIANGGIAKNSYKLQNKLSDSKSNFANDLLYEILICEEIGKMPKLPKYIVDGLDFLDKQLGGESIEL